MASTTTVTTTHVPACLGAPTPSEFPRYNRRSLSQDQYLCECMKHVQAEYWASFQGAVGDKPVGWRRWLDTYDVVCYRTEQKSTNLSVAQSPNSYSMVITDATNAHTSANTQLPELLGHLCIYRENLFFANSCKLKCGCDSMMELEGKCRLHPWGTYVLEICYMCSMKDYPDPDCTKQKNHQSLLYSLGYFEDYFKAYRLLNTMSNDVERGDEATSIPMLAHIMQPEKSRSDGAILTDACWRPCGSGGNGMLNSVADVTLCLEQRQFVERLNYPVEFILGPPGTGKSALICAIVRERVLVEKNGSQGKTLIITAQNKALDLLVRRFEQFVDNDFATSNMGMFVVGSASNSNMGDSAVNFTMSSLLNQNTEYTAALRAFLSNSSDDQLRSELSTITKSTKTRILNSAQLVFSTVSGLSSLLSLELKEDISNVIVDEASMIPEWQAALLAVLPQVKGLVWIGDVKQLPPFTSLKQSSSSRYGNNYTAVPRGYLDRMNRRMEKLHITVPMLTRQFRMHPDIASLVSDAFYQGRLISNSIEFPVLGLKVHGINWLDYTNSPPTHYFQVMTNKHGIKSPSMRKYIKSPSSSSQQHIDHEEKIGYSYVNPTEVHHIIESLKMLAGENVMDTKSVIVICFYKKQVELLQAELERENHPYLDHYLANGSIRVLTVDASQGTEADIVFLSVVRSNHLNEVGFLAGENGARRVNVALSRACEALVIVGNTNTLAQCKDIFAFPQLTQDWRYGVKVRSSFDQLMSSQNVLSFQDQWEEGGLADTFGHYMEVSSSDSSSNSQQAAEYEDLDGDFM